MNAPSPLRPPDCSRRDFLAGTLAAGAGFFAAGSLRSDEPAAKDVTPPRKAQVTITLDLEMSANFPNWEDTHWNYQKGNLNDETKAYTVEACRRVKAHGGVLHSFVVGQVLEQENVDWLKEIAAAGHPLGNHTYDHVYLLAQKPEEIQHRFRRSPWLIAGRPTAEVIRENIRLCSLAMKERLGVDPAGFRTPGGFAHGLADRPDLQQMLLDLGFRWASSRYPRIAPSDTLPEHDPATLEAIVAAQTQAQPFAYPSGLVEVPMSPISDIGAFRTGHWRLGSFLEAIRRGLTWAIEHRAAYDFLSHPSCLYVKDPKFEAIELICDLVAQAGDRAEIVDMTTLARRASQPVRETPQPAGT